MSLKEAISPATVRTTPLWQFVWNLVLLALLARIALWLYAGFRIRLKFRKLQAQGIPIPAGHSWLLGHIPLVRRIGATLPADSADVYILRDLTIDWRTHFPDGTTTCPAVIYVDLWPVAAAPVALVISPAMCQAVVMDRYPPRHAQAKYISRAVAGDRSLFEWDGAEHRLWRTRLNPGFSLRNLQSHITNGRVVDEVVIFAERMKRSAGRAGDWGEVFQLRPWAADLTFDIICGIVLDFSPGEQIRGPTKLHAAFKTLVEEYFAFKSLKLLGKQLNPFWHLQYWRCHRELRQALLPHIQKHLQVQPKDEKNPATAKTVVELALKEVLGESGSTGPSKDFIEDVVGLTKQFIFAGYDTTALTLSFIFHFLQKHPEALRKLREEHDRVLGADPSKAPSVLRASPHLLGSLAYTNGVIKETLRLCPVASSVRDGTPGFSLHDPDTGVDYPAEGFVIVTGVRTIHYRPDLWPRHAEFLPERWTVGEDDPLYPRTKHAWRAFELGPMSCIGQELAVIELKLAMVFTVRELEFETALDEWDRLHGRTPGARPKMLGDSIYQTNVGLGPPTEGLPMRVRLLSKT